MLYAIVLLYMIHSDNWGCNILKTTCNSHVDCDLHLNVAMFRALLVGELACWCVVPTTHVNGGEILNLFSQGTFETFC